MSEYLETFMIKVFIVDDHVLIREGLKKILDSGNGFQIIGEASNAFEAVEAIRKNSCDLLLLDVNLPGRNGLELVEEVKQLRPEIRTLVISMSPEEHYAIRALKAGASGYITKDSASDTLITAINTIMSRGKYISPSVAQLLAGNFENLHSAAPHSRLSNRELEIMSMIAEGKSIKNIAESLSLSISSVNSYRSRIMGKMHMKSNTELTFYAIKNGLIG